MSQISDAVDQDDLAAHVRGKAQRKARWLKEAEEMSTWTPEQCVAYVKAEIELRIKRASE